MIWEPFVLALVLGLLVSAGLYFAYLWPSVEPFDEDDVPPTRQTRRAGSEPPKPAEPTKSTDATEPTEVPS